MWFVFYNIEIHDKQKNMNLIFYKRNSKNIVQKNAILRYLACPLKNIKIEFGLHLFFMSESKYNNNTIYIIFNEI